VSGNGKKRLLLGRIFPHPCLPTQRSFRFEALVRELSERDAALVMSALEDHLLQAGCFCFVASHRHRPAWIDEHPGPLRARSVDGLMAPGTPRTHAHLPVPAVTVSGHNEMDPVTHVGLDQQRATHLAVGFDDIEGAAFRSPALTTVWPPFRKTRVDTAGASPTQALTCHRKRT
jgi:DNA-binding LacI/PurR family transcriptional regulator